MDQDKLWAVGVGSSAGGLEALQAFVAHLPKDVPAAIIIAQHLAPHAKSMLVELLARHSTLPVSVVTHGEKLKAARIYIVPPNHDIELSDGRMFLHRAGTETRPKPSVNSFFESLARTWGERAVGIILSGTGTDGTEGIQAIRSNGGMTLAQDDVTARYDGMPKSAVDSGGVDSILPPDVMGAELGRLITQHDLSKSKSESSNDSTITQIIENVREKTGLNFSPYKMATIRRRIEKHMRTSGVPTWSEYLERLRKSEDFTTALSQELLVSVTSFFRDSDAFALLEENLERTIISAHSGQEIRIWCAGCATGEEAYSLAMIVSELIRKHAKHLRAKVFATDLDQEALIEARTGIYSAEDLKPIKKSLRDSYFRPRGEAFEVDKALRDLVVFARQDLTQSAPFVKTDVITCRNVMIYFGPELQNKVLELFHYSLKPGGLLLLGKSESIGTTPGLFEQVDRKGKLFRKLNVLSKVIPSNYLSYSAVPRRPLVAASPISELAQKEVMSRFEVSGVVIDENFNMLHVLGGASRFLQYPEGQTTLNLTQLLSRGAGAELPVIIKRALKTGKPQKSRNHTLSGGEKGEVFQLHVRPLSSPDNAANRMFLVLFEQFKERSPAAAPQIASDDVHDELQSHELRRELEETREHLQTVIEELGISNEELQSLNEELNSTNEELQSTNEEMETTNEELQSANEELTTVNEELANKTSELRQTNTDLEHTQNSIDSPMLIVDNELRVVRFNRTATRLFDISLSDIGRVITRVSCHCEIPGFHDLIVNTLNSGKLSEVLVERFDSVYQLRVLPNRDEARHVTGAILIFFDNSEILRTEEKLRASEQRVRAIVNSSPSLISLKDASGRYLVVNQALSEFFNVDANAMIGKTDRELFAPDLATRLRDADLDVLYRKAVTKSEEKLKDDRSFIVSRFPLSESDDTAPNSVGMVAVDVSERVTILERLAESERRYRTIVEDQAVLVCRLDPSERIVFANVALATYFGLDDERSKGRSFLELVEPHDRDHVQQQLHLLSGMTPVVHFEHRHLRAGNEPRWVRWTFSVNLNQEGRAEDVQGVGIDITDYRLQADRLQHRELIFSHIFNHTSDFLTVFRVKPGPTFEVESFNPSAEQLMGYSFSHVIGRTLTDLLEPAKRAEYLNRFKECFESRRPTVFEEEMKTPGGVRFLSTTLVPVVNEKGNVEQIASLSRDVSGLKKIETELRTEKERAELASRSKSDFLATMSHELRTPLNVMLGMAQILDDSKLNTDQTKYVTSIRRSGQALLSLIEDILDLSKIEEGRLHLKTHPFSLRDLLSEVEESFDAVMKQKDLVFKIHVSPNVPAAVIGDPWRLRQVLINLIGNALKFTDKGSVMVDLSMQENGMTSPEFAFRVVDTGIGVKEDQHERLFQKFSQADSGSSRRFGGSGLGLSISKYLIELMNGEIGFFSSWGKGSTFWFKVSLPIADEKDLGSLRPKREDLQSQIVKKMRILAVDDNLDSQEFIQLLLRSMGHEVGTASSGLEAIEKLKREAYDLVLMDVQMPGQDGLETTTELRRTEIEQRDIPVIALTANAMSGDAQKCLDAGMNDYLSKPLQKENLKVILKKWSEHARTTSH